MSQEFKFDPANLDFDTIMSKMKTYFETSGKFNDYDFSGSAMQALMRVLAWNTHQNALIANMSSNEAFLDTAQLRGSVVSHAKPLGYLPRSARSATASVRLTLQNVPPLTDDITIPKWTKFTTSIDSKVYTFYTLDEATATNSNSYTVDVAITEGKKLTKRFIVDSDDYPAYVIPNTDLDTTTMTVTVKDGLNTTSGETYTVPTKVEDLTSTSTNYFIYESPNGYYEVYLGDDIIGKEPPAGSVVDIEFLKSSSAAADGASVFATSATFGGYSAEVSTLSNSTGGSDREGIDSIKFNAPKSFAAQNRAVTVNDYSTFIQSEANFVETLNVWGGEENDPPNFGKVYICVKPVGAETLTDAQKTQILDVIIAPKAIITVGHEIVDASFEYLEIDVNVNYDSRQTPLSSSQLESQIKNTILEYGTTNLATFNSAFRKSRLMSYIDDSEAAVLTVAADVKIQRRLKPTVGVKARYDLSFTTPIASVTEFDSVVSSTAFSYIVNGTSYTCYLRNKVNSTQLEIYRGGSEGEVIVVDDAGFIDTTNNKIVLLPFEPSGFPDSEDGIRFSVRPADENTIKPQRDLLLEIDSETTSVNATRET